LNLFKNEKYIINVVKYGAIVSIVIFTFIITQIFIYQKNSELDSDLKILEEHYLTRNEISVENLVNKIYKLIELEKEFGKNDFDDEIKEEVEQAYSIAMSIYNEDIKKPNYSKEKTLDSIKSALRAIRFKNNGYLFLYEMQGKSILNTEFSNIEGKNLWNYKDSRGTLILQEMNKILNTKNETAYEWYWKKNISDEMEYKKIGYFKKFEPFNMFIGSGYYEKDFYEQNQKKILKKLNSFELKKPEHIFIYDLNGLCLVNPKKELIGVNRYDVKNENGEYSIRESLDFVQKNKEGFIKYTSSVKVIENLKSNNKISFVKLYEDFGWMIGSGFYLEELSNQIKEKKKILVLSNEKAIRNISLIALVVSSIMILISFYFSKIIKDIFSRYKSNIKIEMNKSIEKEKLLVQQSKMSMMGEMIGSIAHQWKQPLSIISMSNGLLKLNREIKDFSAPKEIDDSISNIDNAIKHLSQTIDDFRNFFNPNKEKCFYKISEAFEDTLKLIDSQFRNNNIEIIKDINEVELFGSKNELLQTLINLLKNAKEALIINTNLEKKYIFISAYKENDELVIKIKDNANGIPNNLINNIFDPYFTTKEKTGGTGIGLYMCKQIIEGNMKGKIQVSNIEYSYENETFHGAEFLIRFSLNLKNII
jgi:two-component system, NtrC family, sensor kinase